ncbi:MAG: MotA/TolQ/ExbB proton channel family protein [Opitutales bacterium]
MKKIRSRLLPFIAAAFFLGASQWMLSSALNAQETDPDVDVDTVAEEIAESPALGGKSLIDMYKAGGWAMYPLTLLSVSAFGLIVYNFIAVKPGPILRNELMPEIEEALANVDIERAQSVCEQNPSPTTNIIHAGLQRVDPHDYNPEQVKEAVEEASAEELSDPFVLINYLAVIGSLSPMVGLLGTVSGMVKAFNVIEAEGAGSAQALAGNISEALITTASGMIIGIPAMFFFFYFKNKYGKITSRVGRVVGDLQFTLDKAIKQR